jgi:hypothetical protein
MGSIHTTVAVRESIDPADRKSAVLKMTRDQVKMRPTMMGREMKEKGRVIQSGLRWFSQSRRLP